MVDPIKAIDNELSQAAASSALTAPSTYLSSDEVYSVSQTSDAVAFSSVSTRAGLSASTTTAVLEDSGYIANTVAMTTEQVVAANGLAPTPATYAYTDDAGIAPLGETIEAALDEAIAELVADNPFYENFYADIIKPDMKNALMLSPDDVYQLQLLATEGKLDQVKQKLKDIATQLASGSYYMQRLRSDVLDKMLLSTDQRNEIESLFNQGKYDEVRAYFNSLAETFKSQYLIVLKFRDDVSGKLLISQAQKDKIIQLGNEGKYDELRTYLSQVAEDFKSRYLVTLTMRSDVLSHIAITPEQKNKIIQLGNEGKYDELRTYLKGLADAITITKNSTEKQKMTKQVLSQAAGLTNNDALKNALFTTQDVSGTGDYGPWGNSIRDRYRTTYVVLTQAAGVTDNTALKTALFTTQDVSGAGDFGAWGNAIHDRFASTYAILHQGATLDNAQLATAFFATVQIKIDGTEDYGPWGNAIRDKVRTAISLLNQYAALDNTVVESALFTKKKTDYYIVDLETLDRVKSRIKFLGYLQQLMVLLVQSKGDSRNLIDQIMVEQTGYQKMNLEKLASKRVNSLGNYTNTRSKEIYKFINSHNEVVKNAQLRDQYAAKDSPGFFIFTYAVGIISFVAGLIASIFSAGIAAPLAISAISTTVELLNVFKDSTDDIALKKKQMELEEDLALLRAGELRQERELLQKKTAELQQLRQQATGNKEYQDMLDMQITLNNEMLNGRSTSSFTHNGYSAYSLSAYADNMRRVQSVASMYRYYAAIKRSAAKGRAAITEELGIGSASTSSAASESYFTSTISELLERMNKMAELEFERSQLVNKHKALHKALERSKLNMSWTMSTKVFFAVVDMLTFNAGGTAIKNVVLSTGRSVTESLQKYFVFTATPGDYDVSEDTLSVQESYDSYLSLLSDGKSFMTNLTANQYALDYSKYFATLKTFQERYLVEQYESAILEQSLSSRGMVHQAMTSVKAATTDVSQANISIQQNNVLLKDILQKQAYLINQHTQAVNQEVVEQQQLLKSGWYVITSMLSGAVSLYASAGSGDRKKIDGLLSSTFEFILQNEQEDVFDLMLQDSDFYLNVSDGRADTRAALGSQDQYEETLRSFLSDATMFTKDSHGQVVLDPQKVAIKYRQLQRNILTQTVYASVKEAARKSRDLVHMELAEEATVTVNTQKIHAKNTQDSIADTWNILTQQLQSMADLLSRKSLRYETAQRNMLQTVLGLGISGAALAATGNAETAQATQRLVSIGCETSFMIQDYVDTTIANTLSFAGKINEDQNQVVDQLSLQRMEEKEQEIMVQMIALRNIQGGFQIQAANMGQVEFLSFLMERISRLREKIMEVRQAKREARNTIRSTIASMSGELTAIADDVVEGVNGFVQGQMQQYKGLLQQKTQQANQRQRKVFQSTIDIMNNALEGAYSITPFMNESSVENFVPVFTALRDAVPALQTAVVMVGSRAAGSASMPVFDATVPIAVRDAVYSAGLESEIGLIEETAPLLENARKVLQNTLKSMGHTVNREIAERRFKEYVNDLLHQRRMSERTADDLTTDILTGYKRVQELQEKYIKAMTDLVKPESMTVLESAFLNNKSLFENIYTYFTATESDQRQLEQRLPSAYVEMLQAIRSYNVQYQTLIKDASELSAIYGPDTQFVTQAVNYARTVMAFDGQPSPVYRGFMMASNILSTTFKNISDAQGLLANVSTYTGLIDQQIAAGGDRNAIQKDAVSSLLSALPYYEIEAPKTAEAIDALQQYHDNCWRKLYAVITEAQEQKEVNQAWDNVLKEEPPVTSNDPAKPNRNIQKEYEQATADYEVLRELFNNAGLTEDIDILSAELSPGLKLYISQIAGGSKQYSREMRDRLMEYTRRKAENLYLETQN